MFRDKFRSDLEQERHLGRLEYIASLIPHSEIVKTETGLDYNRVFFTLSTHPWATFFFEGDAQDSFFCVRAIDEHFHIDCLYLPHFTDQQIADDFLLQLVERYRSRSTTDRLQERGVIVLADPSRRKDGEKRYEQVKLK